MDKNTTVYAGSGISGLLGLAFIILKLCGVIDWSWWWVTAPFWIPLGLFILILVVTIIVSAIIGYVRRRRRWRIKCKER